MIAQYHISISIFDQGGWRKGSIIYTSSSSGRYKLRSPMPTIVQIQKRIKQQYKNAANITNSDIQIHSIDKVPFSRFDDMQ